ncbi:hypothetical protein ACJA27_03270 [Mycoplasmopsis lipophila]|uniref:hypothetical protein n=1 Tax=Mycoplasmopsis lipophila TaxID=2117 RepID=UPI0038735DFF
MNKLNKKLFFLGLTTSIVTSSLALSASCKKTEVIDKTKTIYDNNNLSVNFLNRVTDILQNFRDYRNNGNNEEFNHKYDEIVKLSNFYKTLLSSMPLYVLEKATEVNTKIDEMISTLPNDFAKFPFQKFSELKNLGSFTYLEQIFNDILTVEKYDKTFSIIKELKDFRTNYFKLLKFNDRYETKSKELDDVYKYFLHIKKYKEILSSKLDALSFLKEKKLETLNPEITKNEFYKQTVELANKVLALEIKEENSAEMRKFSLQFQKNRYTLYRFEDNLILDNFISKIKNAKKTLDNSPVNYGKEIANEKEYKEFVSFVIEVQNKIKSQLLKDKEIKNYTNKLKEFELNLNALIANKYSIKMKVAETFKELQPKIDELKNKVNSSFYKHISAITVNLTALSEFSNELKTANTITKFNNAKNSILEVITLTELLIKEAKISDIFDENLKISEITLLSKVEYKELASYKALEEKVKEAQQFKEQNLQDQNNATNINNDLLTRIATLNRDISTAQISNQIDINEDEAKEKSKILLTIYKSLIDKIEILNTNNQLISMINSYKQVYDEVKKVIETNVFIPPRLTSWKEVYKTLAHHIQNAANFLK